MTRANLIASAERAVIMRAIVAAVLSVGIVVLMCASASACTFTNNGRVLCGTAATHSTSHRVGRFHLVTISTAAGIEITVARRFAPKIRGFIADLVARGYHPRRIHCYARGGHVRHSLHYSGRACDFDQRGWNKTARAMYRVGALAAKWDLRDGCTFRHPRHDCGHIDAGRVSRPRVARL